jgi:hypothetical protein
MVAKVIYNILTSDSDLTASIGTKVFPLVAPKDIQPTYIVYNIISHDDKRTKGAGHPIRDYRIQLDIYAETALKSFEVADLVESALNYKSGEFGGVCTWYTTLINSMTDFDDDSEIFRYMLEYQVSIQIDNN